MAGQLVRLAGQLADRRAGRDLRLSVPVSAGRGIHWATVGVGVALAIVGELVELAAGAAGRGRTGASRRAMVLALLGTVVGSVLGAFVAIPIPIVGPIIGAVGGGALGAFAGVYIGETAIGRSTEQSLAAGKGAMIGRLLGTASKLVIGVVLFVVVAVNALI